jgi:hypothetical protein
MVRRQVIEHYLHHAQTGDDFTPETKHDLLLNIGQIAGKHETIRKNLVDIAMGVNNDEVRETVDRARGEIVVLFETLPRIDYFESLALTCDDKSFFETLLMTIKNTALSAQHSFYKIKAISKDTIKKRLSKLKLQYVENQDEIFALEGRLSRIVETELREEVTLIRNFERLSDEKITPYFMALAKQTTTDAVLSDIRNDNGTKFIDCTERERYITNYYSELYSNKENRMADALTINEFLGEVSHYPDVVSSKLTDAERTDLDRPLSIQELDKSIKKAKKYSARY